MGSCPIEELSVLFGIVLVYRYLIYQQNNERNSSPEWGIVLVGNCPNGELSWLGNWNCPSGELS